MALARILVTGSRRYDDAERVDVELFREVERLGLIPPRWWDQEPPEPLAVIVHGDADGLDTLAAQWADSSPLAVSEGHAADWGGPCRPECQHGVRRLDHYGRDYCPAAGSYRNQHMIGLGADSLVAFPLPDSRGTWNCVKLAMLSGIPHRVVR